LSVEKINEIAVAGRHMMSVECSSVEMSLQIVLESEDRSSVRCAGRLFQTRGTELKNARAANAEVVNGM